MLEEDNKMKIEFIFAWYDLWIGFFWDSKKNALYFFPVPMLGMRIKFFWRRCYVLRKRGYFYRPNASGYTGRIEEAARYTLKEATRREYPHDDPVTKHHIKEFI